jgi:hypothetical protein
MMNPFPMWQLMLNQQRMMVDAAMTIWHRSLLGANGQLKPSEIFGMIAEKQLAANEAALQVLKSVNRRKTTAEQLASAALKPYSKRTRANAKRLGRKK